MKRRVVALVAAVMLMAVLTLQTTTVFALPPIFNNQTVEIAEDSVTNNTTTPPKLSAFDPEQGSSNLTFTETGGSGAALFNVATDGTVSFVGAGGDLDYEGTKTYTLNVTVKDLALEEKSAVVTIAVTNVSDEPPTMAPQQFSVAENSANNSVVGTIAVTDADGPGETFDFDVTGGTGEGVFSVGPTNGQIKVIDSTQLDYESPTKQYSLIVEVDDEGGNGPATATMTIDVSNVNEAPVIVPAGPFSVAEDAPNGTVVGTVSATDPEGLSVTYSIVGSTPFAINASSGQITVANSSQLDHEAQAQISVTVKAADPGNNSSNASVTINVTDVNDPPKALGLPDKVVNEGSSPDTINLRNFFTDDEDPSAQLTYEVTANTNTSLVSTQISAEDVLTLTYAPQGDGIANITVRAVDTGGEDVVDTFKVDINDAPTTSGIADFSVNEDAANTIIDLYSVFADAEDADSALAYAIVSNSNPGLVAVSITDSRNLVLNYNDNANGFSNIKVKATDTGGLTVDTTFKVTVTAVNDNPTTNGLNDVQVDEDAPDKTVPLFPAFDDVEDEDTALTFSVTGNTNPGLFVVSPPAINAQTGIMTLKFKPNTSGAGTLTVRATDTGGKFVEASFNVTIGSAADKPVVTDFTGNTDEDTVLAFTEQMFVDHFTDDDSEPLVKVKIVSLPAKGTLKRGNVTLKANDEVNAGDLDSLTFTPEKNWDTGTTSFEWNASDGNTYADKAAKVTISVNAVNDPPEVFDFTKTGDEDKDVNFTANDFSSISAYLDVEGTPLASVRILSLPANGTLKLGNNDVGTNQTIAVANLGTLRFVPTSDWSGTTEFEWNGSDGQLFAEESAMVAITITPKNDPPQIDLNGGAGGTGYTALFNTNAGPVIVGGPAMTLTDTDGGTLAAAYVQIDKAPDGASETLDANKSGTDIKVSYNSSKRELTLQGPDTIENFLTVLKTVTYNNSSKTPNVTQRSIEFQAYDGQAFSNTAVTKVDTVQPEIMLSVAEPFQTVISGDTALFTITIENSGDVDLEDVTLTSNVADCNKGLVKQTLAAGDSLPPIVCSVSGVTQRIDNQLVVTAQDTTGGPDVTSEVTAVVRVSNPNIYVEILADPLVGYTVPSGTDVPLLVIVGNPSQTRLKDVTLTAALTPIVSSEGEREQGAFEAPTEITCNFDVIALNGGQTREFTCTVAAVTAPVAVEVSAVGTIDNATDDTVEDFDRAELNILDIGIDASADLFEVPAGNATDVVFSVTLTNNGSTDVTLTQLTSLDESGTVLHGNLLDAANALVKDSTCAVSGEALILGAAGGTFACSYTASVTAEFPTFVNRITFAVEDDTNNQVTGSKDIELSVSEDSGVRAILNANPAAMIAPGGNVELLVQVRNNESSVVMLQSMEISEIGSLDGKGDCSLPQAIEPGDSYLCSHTITRDGLSAGDELKFVLSATVDGEILTDDVLIRVTERGTIRSMLPMVPNFPVFGEPNNDKCNPLSITTGVDYIFYPDDVNDYYKVVLDKPGTIQVKMSNYQVVKGQIILYVAPNCQAISNDNAINDGSELPEKSITLPNAPAGTYFIRVYSATETSPVPYTLRVNHVSP